MNTNISDIQTIFENVEAKFSNIQNTINNLRTDANAGIHKMNEARQQDIERLIKLEVQMIDIQRDFEKVTAIIHSNTKNIQGHENKLILFDDMYKNVKWISRVSTVQLLGFCSAVVLAVLGLILKKFI